MQSGTLPGGVGCGAIMKTIPAAWGFTGYVDAALQQQQSQLHVFALSASPKEGRL